MSLPALIGFAGVLVAAVATGMLAGRAVRQPRTGTILRTAATLALTVALAAQSTGFASGFGPATFRAVQLLALALAPLWLAWGLAEQTWPGEAVRFGARLVGGALTVVGGVILVTDPLTAQPFGKAWPSAGQHYQPFSHYVLDVTQVVAVLTALVGAATVAARSRQDRRLGALAGTAQIGLAVLLTAGLRFSLPARSAYPLLSLLAAALVWFGATRLEARPGRLSRGRMPPDRAGRGRAARDAGIYAADVRYRREASHATNGHRGPRARYDPGAPGDRRAFGDPGRRPDGGRPPAPRPAVGGTAAMPGGAAAEVAPPAKPELPATPPYGRILIFTLLDDRAGDFDRLAEQTAEEVRLREPDTLVYVIHLVPNAPMQRIFYEIYLDRAAFDSHENQPYMKRFVADRRAYVLATNVIELKLKYAKVAPLPKPQSSGPHPRALRPQALEPLPPRPDRRLPSAERRYGGGN